MGTPMTAPSGPRMALNRHFIVALHTPTSMKWRSRSGCLFSGGGGAGDLRQATPTDVPWSLVLARGWHLKPGQHPGCLETGPAELLNGPVSLIVFFFFFFLAEIIVF